MKNGIKLLIVLSGMLVLSGCASGPAFNEIVGQISDVGSGQGRIYIYRSNPMGAAVQPAVKLNGEEIGTAVPKGFFYVDRPAGSYEIETTTEVKRSLSLTLDNGQTRYVRLGISMGFFVGHVYPELVENSVGEQEIQSCKYIFDFKPEQTVAENEQNEGAQGPPAYSFPDPGEFEEGHLKWKIPPVEVGDLVHLKLMNGNQLELEVTNVTDMFVEGMAEFPGVSNSEKLMTKVEFRNLKSINNVLVGIEPIIKWAIPSVKNGDVVDLKMLNGNQLKLEVTNVSEQFIEGIAEFPGMSSSKKLKTKIEFNKIKSINGELVAAESKGGQLIDTVSHAEAHARGNEAPVYRWEIPRIKAGETVDVIPEKGVAFEVRVEKVDSQYIEGFAKYSGAQAYEWYTEKFYFKDMRKLNGKTIPKKIIPGQTPDPGMPGKQQRSSANGLFRKGDDIDIETNMNRQVTISITRVGGDYVEGTVRRMMGSGGSEFPERFEFTDIRKVNGKTVSQSSLAKMFN